MSLRLLKGCSVIKGGVPGSTVIDSSHTLMILELANTQNSAAAPSLLGPKKKRKER
jgi:hypothetical protein